MSSRFSLRFVSGDRAGEVYELLGPRVTIGRKPGNSLQIVDSSISGTHAEFLLMDGRVVLRDRNSTNGTKVAGVKVTEREVGHGDSITFGTVQLVIEDAEITTEAAEFEDEADGVASVGAAALAESGSGSRFGFLIVIAVVLLVGVVAWYGVGLIDSKGAGSAPSVAVVEGDLFDGDGSFEANLGSFSNDESASAEFLHTPAAAVTGAGGVRAVLVAGEHARIVSKEIATRSGTVFAARVSYGADAGTGARLGLVFTSASGAMQSTAWSGVFVGEGEAALLDCVTPPGHDRVQLLVAADATADGSLSVDDASLVRAGSSSGALELGGFGFHLLGEPTQVLCITKVSTVLVSGLSVSGATLSGGLSETGMDFTAGSGGDLGLAVDGGLVERGVASLGEGGYRVHGATFDREDVTSVLLGSGTELIAIHWELPCKVRARAEGDGMRLEAALSEGAFRVQVDFAVERIHAGDLAYAARGAERDGHLGECLGNWAELLERYPYQQALVVEAEGARGRLVQEGLLALQGVRAEIERASFFRLVELYRSCRDRAKAVGARYAGSEVETEALDLVAAVEVELVGLEVDLDADEVTRLRSIHAVLLASDAPRLADEVAEYLGTEFGAGVEGGGR